MLSNKLSHCRSEMISFQIKGARWRQMLRKQKFQKFLNLKSISSGQFPARISCLDDTLICLFFIFFRLRFPVKRTGWKRWL